MSNGIALPDVNGLFDTIYVAHTLKELHYRGVKVEPGLTEGELRAVERAVGASLPPDLALLLRGTSVRRGLPQLAGRSGG